ncbi:hypothetical protein JCM21900_003937 [Sporobolomyces salmonicolor]
MVGVLAPAPLSSSWEPLGETYYRRIELYDLADTPLSQLDLDDHIVAAARWGGPVAIMRDERKPVPLAKLPIGKPKIHVYSSAGAVVQTISWDSPSKILSLGWTASEALVVLTQDGTYRLYTLATGPLPPSYTQHSLGSDVADTGIVDARIWEDGMVVLLANLAFVEVKGWGKGGELEGGAGAEEGTMSRGTGRTTLMASAGIQELPECWSVIPPEVSSTRGTEVLIGTGGTVLRLDEIEVQDQHIDRGRFLSITPSPNGRFLALLTKPSLGGFSQLWVTSSDFSRSLSESDLSGEGEQGPPKQVAWCGSNSVVVAWERTVVMVGPFGETLKYFYTDPVHLVCEIDGTRILSSESCDLLQIVPHSSQAVFLPGSASPSAILYEASELFDQRSPKADEFIRNIKQELLGAVEACIDAAGREWEPVWQKKLLKAAAFGKSFLDVYNPSDFVQTSKMLRVLNAVRFYQVGIPLTFEQYRARPLAALLARLYARSQHLLALRISSFLGLSPSPVLKHWAQQLIASSSPSSSAVLSSNALPQTDEEICSLIVRKLSSVSSPTSIPSSRISFPSPAPASPAAPATNELSCADIALTAWKLGRTQLATMLIEKEIRASKQVPLLLRMKEDEGALRKAIESGDPDLVFAVLLSLRRSHPLGDLFRLIAHQRDAIALLQVYARETDEREMLRDFYYQDDRREEMAVMRLEEAMREQDFGERVAKVRGAAKSFGEDKDCGFEAKMAEDQVKLLVLQQSLEQESPGKTFVGLSVNDTLRQCIMAGLGKRAEKVRSDFKVPDKRYWYIKLKSLIALRDWDALEAFARSKKSPIGYEPWVEHLIEAGAQRQAVKFIERCEGRNRVELYVKAGEWVTAGQECVRRGERGRLIDLKNRAPNSIVAAQLNELLNEMNNSGM